MNPWLMLFFAIAAELTGTLALKTSKGFTKFLPSLVVVAGYLTAFYCLSVVVQSIPLGIAYAVWSGVGIAATAVLGVALFNERLNRARLGGIALVVLGVVLLQLG